MSKSELQERGRPMSTVETTYAAHPCARPTKHSEGYAVNVWRGETRLATCYGATPQEAFARASLVSAAFNADEFGRDNE